MDDKYFVTIEDKEMPVDIYQKPKKSNGFVNLLFLVNAIITFVMWITLLLVRG